MLRQRGNNYLEHLEAGQPPVLVFKYEVVVGARTFERPVNYALVRIPDRRDTADDRRKQPRETQGKRRRDPLHRRDPVHRQ